MVCPNCNSIDTCLIFVDVKANLTGVLSGESPKFYCNSCGEEFDQEVKRSGT